MMPHLFLSVVGFEPLFSSMRQNVNQKNGGAKRARGRVRKDEYDGDN